MANRSDLQELVDSPNETPAAEYKEWLDLSDNGARADVARHIAALANSGGGFIVFGFDDAMQPTGGNPYPAYDRDVIGGIVRKYLEPPMHCDVHAVASAQGAEHAVVVVPPHGASPVCAKAGGPMVNGRSVGITQGIYYVRKPLPESAPIQSPAEWAPITRRLVMHERTAILAAIDVAIRGRGAATGDELLRRWHQAADEVFRKDVADSNAPPAAASRHWQLGYSIESGDDQVLPLNDLPEILRQANLQVQGLVSTGWSLFYPFTRPGLAPTFSTDPNSGLGDREFIQASLMRDDQGPRVDRLDLWRVAPNGLATIVLDYVEDEAERSQAVGVQAGSWFNPNLMVMRIAEVVRHALAMTERFASPLSVSFLCEWHGLEGRQVLDPESLWVSGRTSREGHRVASGSWPVTSLESEWATIVCELAAPVCRLFGIEQIVTPAWVLNQAKRWRSFR